MAATTISSAALLADALAASGVGEPASLDFLPALERLVAAFNRNPHMHAAGRAQGRALMLKHLTARLKAERYWQDHPEIQDLPVTAPVFVLGMPRTGSTMAVNLFDQDPRWRTLLKWQVFDPVPPATTETLRTDPRCLALLAEERAAFGAGANPNIHFEWADTPTECVLVHMQDFMSNAWEAYAADPEFSEYMLDADMVPAYRWHRKLLQILQSRAPGRWIVKAPSHALYVESLLKVYPDARLIWTHRDPFEAVPSLFSLMLNVHRRYMDQPDARRIGQFYMRQLRAHVDRIAAVKARDPGRVYDLRYDRVMATPAEAIREAYAWLGMPFDESTRAGIETWLAENPQGKFGSHTYALEDYDVSRDEVAQAFAGYLAANGASYHE